MLTVSARHVEALSDRQQGGFVSRMALHLREVFPSEVERLDDRGLGAFVEKVCAQAEEWDITEEQHVERLLELYASFESLRTTRLPDWISRIVRDPNRSAEQAVSELEDRLRFGGES